MLGRIFGLAALAFGAAGSASAEPPPPTAGPCTAEGVWTTRVDRDWSMWRVSANGVARETGLGEAQGTARVKGRTLTIHWTDGRWQGDFVIALDADCRTGKGKMRRHRAGEPTQYADATFARR
jgi:hypothetical protein